MSRERILLKSFIKGFQAFGELIAHVVNSVLLSAVYFVGIGITHIFAKLIGKSFLGKKLSKDQKTYWSKLDLEKESEERYFRQF
jgi:hypothetical protein